MRIRATCLLAALGSAALAGAAQAQDALTATILRGASSRAGSTQPGTPTRLERGMRIESPSGSWTELAFTDGSSIVLEPGAVLTVQGIARDPASGHLVLRAVSDRGRLRVETSNRLDVALGTASQAMRLTAASAVVEAGPNGSVTMISGQRIEVAGCGSSETLRRPGFAKGCKNAGPERQTRSELAQALDVFAPVSNDDQDTAAANGATLASADRAARITGQNANDAVGTPTGLLGGRRTGGAFDVAGLGLNGNGTKGSGFAAPGYNSGTSSVDTSNNFNQSPNSEDPSQAIIGIDSRQHFGTGRIRRFTPEAAGAEGQMRNDSGLVQVGSTTGPVGRYFQLLQSRTLSTSPDANDTFYDGIARVGIVTIQVWQNTKPAVVPSYATIPRISVSDASDANFTVGNATETFNSGPGQPSSFNLAQYRGGAVIEVATRNLAPGLLASTPPPSPGTSAALIGPPPSDGTVFRLSGLNGLAIIRGINLAGISYVTDAASGNDTTKFDLFSHIERAGNPSSVATSNVSPDVYIIDKITEGGPEFRDQRGIQSGERYFVIGGTPISPVAGQPLPGLGTNSVTRFAISDGLNAQAGFRDDSDPNNRGGTIEAQFLSSNRPIAFSQYNAFRPEETFVSGARGDTHLLVVGGAVPNSPAGTRNPAFRTDLQVNAKGQTSGSVTSAASASSTTRISLCRPRWSARPVLRAPMPIPA